MIKISLAAARVNAKLSQAEAAKKMHVSKNTLVNWEKGRIIPSFASLQTLSEIYGIPTDNIFLSNEST